MAGHNTVLALDITSWLIATGFRQFLHQEWSSAEGDSSSEIRLDGKSTSIMFIFYIEDK